MVDYPEFTIGLSVWNGGMFGKGIGEIRTRASSANPS
jgi:hypothetical protein